MKTDSPPKLMNTLFESLPQTFDFYGLGLVELQTQIKDDLWSDKAHAIAYSLKGDIDAWFILRVEFAQDLSRYQEMGNVIASQMATTLANVHGIDVLVSPPSSLSPKAFSRFVANAKPEKSGKTDAQGRAHLSWHKRATYFFKQNATIPMEAWILTSWDSSLQTDGQNALLEREEAFLQNEAAGEPHGNA